MMQEHVLNRKAIGQQSASADGTQRQAITLQDNRPQSTIQRRLSENLAACTVPGTQVHQLRSFAQSGDVMQLARTKSKTRRTVSGHGKLRRDKGLLVPYKVPKGMTIVLSAPPGATLGDISLTLNQTDNPDLDVIRSMIKISTNKDLWRNKTVVSLVRGNNTIKKTKLQEKLLDGLDNGTRSFEDLKGSEKNSLIAIERKPEFEKWAEGYVSPETFQVKNEDEMMDDMEFSSFEPHLRSKKSGKQNEYIEEGGETTLSDYVKDNPGIRHLVINACSDDQQSAFTGFQIDKK